MVHAVLVWDQKGDPPTGSEHVICWQSYAQSDSISSIPRYLEDNAERLRKKYLAFIYDLGESKINGKRIVDHLDLGDRFSYWWMTTLAEKSPLKSPRIYDCLRLIAVEEMLTEMRPSDLTLAGSDHAVSEAISGLCRKLKIGFRCRLTGAAVRRFSMRRIYDLLPYALKGLLSLRHVKMRWPLRQLEVPQWFSGDSAVFLCSYFIHLDPILCAQGNFHSRQWEGLPKALHESGRHTNWIQLFLFSAVVPDVDTGIAWGRRFNADALTQGNHAFLDTYLSLGTVATAFKNWLKLNFVSWRLRKVESEFYPDNSSAWLWPLLRDDWHASLGGQLGMSNCLTVAQFDSALAKMPRQETGLYLCENQAWEKALLHAWRKYGHGRIFGVQHSTAPFWHLYYFDDPRCFTAKQTGDLPMPDYLAVNGAQALNSFAKAGYPLSKLVEVEALRYLGLSSLVAERNRRSLEQPKWQGLGGVASEIKVLVLGDMIPSSMHHLLSLLEGAMEFLPSEYKITLKPHPGYSVALNNYPKLAADEVKDALHLILNDYDVAIAANSTSAAVDAFVAGLPVIIGCSGDELNLSPLRGQPGARFFSTREELVEALQSAIRGESAAVDKQDFFFLDSNMPRWRQLLTPPREISN